MLIFWACYSISKGDVCFAISLFLNGSFSLPCTIRHPAVHSYKYSGLLDSCSVAVSFTSSLTHRPCQAVSEPTSSCRAAQAVSAA